MYFPIFINWTCSFSNFRVVGWYSFYSSFKRHFCKQTIYTEWLKSINYFKGEHAHTPFWLKFEITKCCGGKGNQNPNNSSMSPNTIYASKVEIHPLVQKIGMRKTDFYNNKKLKDGNLEN